MLYIYHLCWINVCCRSAQLNPMYPYFVPSVPDYLMQLANAHAIPTMSPASTIRPGICKSSKVVLIVMNEYYTVIDWVRGQQQFSLTRGRICGFGQQIRSKVKQNCCCPRSQSITVLLYTFIFKKKIFTFSTHIYPLDILNILVRQVRESWHCDFNIMWLREPMKIRPSVNSSIAGNRSMNCWPVNSLV